MVHTCISDFPQLLEGYLDFILGSLFSLSFFNLYTMIFLEEGTYHISVIYSWVKMKEMSRFWQEKIRTKSCSEREDGVWIPEGRKKAKDSHTVSMKINLPGFIVLYEDHTFDEEHCLKIKSLTLYSPSYSIKRNTFTFPNVFWCPVKKKMLFCPSLLFMGILPFFLLPSLIIFCCDHKTTTTTKRK